MMGATIKLFCLMLISALVSDPVEGSDSTTDQLMVVMNQLDSKLVLVAESVRGLEGTMRALENRMGDKMGLLEGTIQALENRVGDKMRLLENRVEDKMSFLETHVTEKIDSLHSHLVDKLCELDSKVSSIGNCKSQPEVGVAELDEHADAASSHENEIQTKQALTNILSISERIDNNLNVHSLTLSSIEKVLTNVQTLWDKSHLSHGDLTEALDSFSNISEVLSLRLGKDMALQQERFWAHFQRDFDSTINASIAENMFSVCDQTSPSAHTNTSQPEAITVSTISDCRKGMALTPAQDPYPYAVITPGNQSGLDFPFLCDTSTDGGGWIIFQRRTTGDVDFDRNWASYRDGFGSLDGDFWLGNEKIHTITSSGNYELRVDVKYANVSAFAQYDSFSLDAEENKYAMNLGTYSGTAGDSLDHHRGLAFSTYDRDNDRSSLNCAITGKGAWWYNSCYHSNLNGQWGGRGSPKILWKGFGGNTNAMTFTEMKIRRL